MCNEHEMSRARHVLGKLSTEDLGVLLDLIGVQGSIAAGAPESTLRRVEEDIVLMALDVARGVCVQGLRVDRARLSAAANN